MGLDSKTIRLYKFYPAKYGLMALKNQQLKVSPLDNLNDPFEYFNVDVGHKNTRKWMKSVRKALGSNGAIISFCKSWHNPVIWSHYAQSHTGMALGFDVPKNLLFKMNYTNEKLTINPAKLSDLTVIKQLLEKVGRTKFEDWSYEEEYRLFIDLKHAKKQQSSESTELIFHPFKEGLKLKEVILGYRYQSGSSPSVEQKLKRAGTQIITARPSFTEFKMTKQRLKSLQYRL